MKDVIKNFIELNKITFKEGERNSNITVLCGFALYAGAEVEDIIASFDKKTLNSSMGEGTMEDEIRRVYEYADLNSYGDWWKEDENRESYVIPKLP